MTNVKHFTQKGLPKFPLFYDIIDCKMNPSFSNMFSGRKRQYKFLDPIICKMHPDFKNFKMCKKNMS